MLQVLNVTKVLQSNWRERVTSAPCQDEEVQDLYASWLQHDFCLAVSFISEWL